MRAAPAPTSAPPAYQLTQLPALAAMGTLYLPAGLGPDGTVIGYKDYNVNVSGGGIAERHTVYLLPPHGSLQAVTQPAGDQIMTPMGLGYHGEIIAVDGYPGYVRVNGKWRLIGGSGAGDPMAINKQGQITGIAGSSAFLANASTGTFRVLGALPCGCAAIGRAISPTGEVVGDAQDDQGIEHAAIFPSNGSPPKLMPFAGGIKGDGGSEADAINAHGEIAGAYGTNGSSMRLFRYDGKLRDAGAIPGLPILVVAGMDDTGRIAGTAAMPNVTSRAFIEGSAGFEDLTTLAGLPKGEVIYSVVKTNAAGDILARADLGHGLVLVLLHPTRPDAGGKRDVDAGFSHVAWQPVPTPVPTIGPPPTSPPAGLLRYWSAQMPWPDTTILRLQAATGLHLKGTLTNLRAGGPLSFPVTGIFAPAAPGAAANFAGGTVTLDWLVPATSPLTPTGYYHVVITFYSDLAIGTGTLNAPNLYGGVSFKPIPPPTK